MNAQFTLKPDRSAISCVTGTTVENNRKKTRNINQLPAPVLGYGESCKRIGSQAVEKFVHVNQNAKQTGTKQ